MSSESSSPDGHEEPAQGQEQEFRLGPSSSSDAYDQLADTDELEMPPPKICRSPEEVRIELSRAWQALGVAYRDSMAAVHRQVFDDALDEFIYCIRSLSDDVAHEADPYRAYIPTMECINHILSAMRWHYRGLRIYSDASERARRYQLGLHEVCRAEELMSSLCITDELRTVFPAIENIPQLIQLMRQRLSRSIPPTSGA